MSKESTICQPEVMNSEDLLFLLYTSGSTGKPKGVAHSQAGYLLYAAVTQKVIVQLVSAIAYISLHSHAVIERSWQCSFYQLSEDINSEHYSGKCHTIEMLGIVEKSA